MMLSLQATIRHFGRKKALSSVLLLFITLSTLLIVSGVITFGTIFTSSQELYDTAIVPDFVQMHKGDINKEIISQFNNKNSHVIEEYQLVPMISLANENIFLFPHTSEASEITEYYFTKQNKNMDLLVSENNTAVTVNENEIAVPLIYKYKKKLSIGDTVNITHANKSYQFKIVAFLKDSMMNSNLITSKRLVINDSTFDNIFDNEHNNQKEYLIEYKLKKRDELTAFSTEYHNNELLPYNGPQIDYNTIFMLNAITVGIPGFTLFFSGFLFNIASAFCFRYALLASMEDEVKNIGLMGALGISPKCIRKLYTQRYALLYFCGTILGYLISIISFGVYSEAIEMIFGPIQNKNALILLGFLVICAINFVSYISIRYLLRTINRIDITQAIQGIAFFRKGKVKEKNRGSIFSFATIDSLNVKTFLAFRRFRRHFSSQKLLLFILVLNLMIFIFPINLYQTITSPQFVNYMGVGQSDIRIDLFRNQKDKIEKDLQIYEEISKDARVEKASTTSASRYRIKDSKNNESDMVIETGNVSTFSPYYVGGRTPQSNSEISLSESWMKELGLQLNDAIFVQNDNIFEEKKIVGVYADITNGGKTAKATFTSNDKEILWSTILIDLKNKDEAAAFITYYEQKYAQEYSQLNIYTINDYIQKTFSETIDQMLKITIILDILVALYTLVILVLFFQIMKSKNKIQDKLMQRIGIKKQDIKQIYKQHFLYIVITAIMIFILVNYIFNVYIFPYVITLISAPTIVLNTNNYINYLLLPLIFIVLVRYVVMNIFFKERKF